MPILGLTGDVGAGKSTLCRVWREMGAAVCDSDTIARSMWALPEVQKEAKKRWGKDFFDDEKEALLSKIAGKIFNDEEEYEFATGLIHSFTIKEIKRFIDSARGWTVVEIPLLFECGLEGWFDGIIYAAADLEKRAHQNKKRHWDKEEIVRREKRLMSREKKILSSRWVLENTGSLEDWEKTAFEFGKQFQEKTVANCAPLDETDVC